MMKKTTLLLAVILLLAACRQTPESDAPAPLEVTAPSSLMPSATPAPSLASTLPPIPSGTPTETPVETPTLTGVELSGWDLESAQDEFVFAYGPNGEKSAEFVREGTENVWRSEAFPDVALEYVNLYGGHVQAMMFVIRSNQESEGHKLEIYTDPKYPIFDHITGSDSQIDDFVGNKVGNAMEGKDAKKVLKTPGSTLKLIIGDLGDFPLASNSGQPQMLWTSETEYQRVWGFTQNIGGFGSGYIGAFIESDNVVQCGWFLNKPSQDIAANVDENPDSVFWNLGVAVATCAHYDPDDENSLMSNFPVDFTPDLKRLLKPELLWH